MNAYREDGLRVPPHSIDAEQAVLGSLMIQKRAWWDVADMLDPEDFYRRDHQEIFRAIKSLATAVPPKPFDTVTLGEWFVAQGKAELVANGAYLLELDRTTPSAANIVGYAEIVADKSRMRRLIEVGTEVVNSAFQPEGRGSVEIIGQAQTGLGNLLASQPCELESMAPLMQRVFDNLEERCRVEGGVHGLSTSLDDLDQLIGGLKPGGLYILAARPKMGKTTLAQNIAEHCALVAGKPVAVFSFEMQPDELGDRMLSSIGGIDGDRIRRGELDDVDWANVTTAMRKLRGAKIFVSRPRSARVEHVVAQARRQHAREPLGLIVIDYLQLMETRGDNRAQGLADITRPLKLMAGELGVPVLLLSQLNRKLEERTDKRPIAADLRDSGAIEQDADAVIFIYRDEIYHRSSVDRGTAEIIVGIQRNGPPGEIRALYQPGQFKFSNLPNDWEPAPAPEKPARTSKGFKKISGKEAAAGADA